MFEKLRARGFTVQMQSHAQAILAGDFPDAAREIEEVLLSSSIPIEEIIGSGGGETKGTQRLRKSLFSNGWRKHNFIVQRVVDGRPLESQSHEIDHIRQFPAGTVALEIEWNNKDPFFDRDLENFKRLHSDGAISLGAIITRGPDLQADLRSLVRRFADDQNINSHDDMERIGLDRTKRQIAEVEKQVTRNRNPRPFRDAWVDHFVSDKFGAATTHWQKLEDRVRRGVGNPCPLLLIGLPVSIVTFGEDPAVVRKLIQDDKEGQENSPE